MFLMYLNSRAKFIYLQIEPASTPSGSVLVAMPTAEIALGNNPYIDCFWDPEIINSSKPTIPPEKF
jgi:hypothetical protein